MSLLPSIPSSEELIKSSNENLAISGKKNTFIKAKVMENHKMWWNTIEQGMMQDEDRELKRLCIIEYNKLQCRLLPTEITGDDGENLTVKVINYAVQNNINNITSSSQLNPANDDSYSYVPASIITDSENSVSNDDDALSESNKKN